LRVAWWTHTSSACRAQGFCGSLTT